MLHGFLFASSDKSVNSSLIETRCTISLGIGTNEHICLLHVGIILVLTVHIYNLAQHSRTSYFIGFSFCALNGNTNNIVGTQFTCYINRIIIS